VTEPGPGLEDAEFVRELFPLSDDLSVTYDQYLRSRFTDGLIFEPTSHTQLLASARAGLRDPTTRWTILRQTHKQLRADHRAEWDEPAPRGKPLVPGDYDESETHYWAAFCEALAADLVNVDVLDRPGLAAFETAWAARVGSSRRTIEEVLGESPDASFNDYETLGKFVAAVKGLHESDPADPTLLRKMAATSLFVLRSVRTEGAWLQYRTAAELAGRVIETIGENGPIDDRQALVAELDTHFVSMDLDRYGDGPIQVTSATVRNALLHLRASPVLRRRDPEEVDGLLDKFEREAGDCLDSNGCLVMTGGCTRSRRPQACEWMLRSYCSLMTAYADNTRTVEPLDASIELCETRQIGAETGLNIELRIVRYVRHRSDEDRRFLHSELERVPLADRPYPLLRLLLEELPGDDDKLLCDDLGIPIPDVTSNLQARATDATAPLTVAGRLNLLLQCADVLEASDHDGLALEALACHWEQFDDLFQLSGVRAARRQLADSRQRSGPLHAELLARAGRHREAVERLEKDRLVQLREEFTFFGARFRELALGIDNLTILEEVRSAAERLDYIAATTDVMVLGKAQAEQAELRDTIIRGRLALSADGQLPSQRWPASFDAVSTRARNCGAPVTYLWSTRRRGNALVVRADGDSGYVDLDAGLSAPEVGSALDRFRASLEIYSRHASGRNRALVTDAVARVVAYLRESDGLGRLLRDESDLVIVPVGDWHGFPLHALSHEQTADISPARLRYAPLGSSLQGTPPRGPRADKPSLVVANPQTGQSQLRWATVERHLIEHVIPSCSSLEGDDATVEVMTDWFAQATGCRLLHVAGHASVDLTADEGQLDQAVISLSQHNVIEPRDWANLFDSNVPELVVISACQSGGISRTYLDDLASVQGSILIAGARDVVVTQWPVSDLVCALFASKLYPTLAGNSWDVADAVHEATSWLRALTVADVVQFVEDVSRRFDLDLDFEVDPTPDPAFPELWYWAPFVHYEA
jgi:hypothetical protein